MSVKSDPVLNFYFLYIKLMEKGIEIIILKVNREKVYIHVQLYHRLQVIF